MAFRASSSNSKPGAYSSGSKTGAFNSNCKPNGATPPEGITQVNDAVWLFHNPDGVPKAEIIFFHGLQLGDYKDAFWKTWLARSDENVVWPKNWLGKTFSTARILAISYDSSAGISDGQLDMYRLGENLVSDIIMDGCLNIGQNNCPVILVGHCLGGIVIKQFILSMEAKYFRDSKTSPKVGRFLQNIKGIFYYGTPHGGFNTEFDKANVISSLGSISEFLQLLLTNGSQRERINDDFRKARENRNMRAFAVMGSLPTKYLGTTVIVVPEESGRRDIDDYYTVNANHFDIARPENETSGIFGKLRNFIDSILDEAKQGFENFQWTPNGVVGLDVIMKEVQDMLLNNSRVGISGVVGKAKMVGIHGMGGIGKTTLAKVVFNKLNPKFEYSCFVPNVKLITWDIKEEVWKGMHHWGKKVGGGDRSQVRGKRLLLVLDDVAQDHHLEVISSIWNEAAPEIHSIVTCRSEQLLIGNDVDRYKIPFLGEEDAKHLFKSYAFSTPGAPTPTVVLEEHMVAIVVKCDGLPLTLEVVGKYLKSVMGKNVKSKNNIEQIWKDTLKALKDADDVAGFDEKIWKKLRVSYDGLGEKEQQMFLDAVTFFSVHESYKLGGIYDHVSLDPWTVWDAKAAWSAIYGQGQIGWETLVDLSLVYDVEDGGGQIRVHEQLQSMGRRIAEGKDGQKRMWELDGELDFLKSNDGPQDQQICSLRLSSQRNREHAFMLDFIPFPEFPEVSYLGRLKMWLSPQRKLMDLGARFLEVIPRSCLGRLKKLEYLDVDSTILHLAIEGAKKNETFPTGNLVVLRCSSLLIFNAASCPRLTVLKLYLFNTITELPRWFGGLCALKVLHLKLFGGEILPDEFGHLVQLERLTFTRCMNLRTLPKTFGLLSRLDYLCFWGCVKLDTLPDSFGHLYTLEHLVFHYCHRLDIFPESIKHLAALKHLEFTSCYGLDTIPEFFGQLSALEHLSFVDCNHLQTLPSPRSFKQLAKLQYFKIDKAPRLQSLPFSSEHLPEALRRLDIRWIGLKSIPDCIKSLPSLQILELDCMACESTGSSFEIARVELPPWLGGGFLDGLKYHREVRTFHVQDGKFILTRFPGDR